LIFLVSDLIPFRCILGLESPLTFDGSGEFTCDLSPPACLFLYAAKDIFFLIAVGRGEAAVPLFMLVACSLALLSLSSSISLRISKQLSVLSLQTKLMY